MKHWVEYKYLDRWSLQIAYLEALGEFREFFLDCSNVLICLDNKRIEHVELQVFAEKAEQKIAFRALLWCNDIVDNIWCSLSVKWESRPTKFGWAHTLDNEENLVPSLKLMLPICLKCTRFLQCGKSFALGIEHQWEIRNSLLINCANTYMPLVLDNPDSLRPDMITKKARVIAMQLVKIESFVWISVLQLVECILVHSSSEYPHIFITLGLLTCKGCSPYSLSNFSASFLFLVAAVSRTSCILETVRDGENISSSERCEDFARHLGQLHMLW